MPSDVCQNCGEGIHDHRQPLYHQKDIDASGEELAIVENPDGPFCGVPCRRDHDDE